MKPAVPLLLILCALSAQAATHPELLPLEHEPDFKALNVALSHLQSDVSKQLDALQEKYTQNLKLEGDSPRHLALFQQARASLISRLRSERAWLETEAKSYAVPFEPKIARQRMIDLAGEFAALRVELIEKVKKGAPPTEITATQERLLRCYERAVLSSYYTQGSKRLMSFVDFTRVYAGGIGVFAGIAWIGSVGHTPQSDPAMIAVQSVLVGTWFTAIFGPAQRLIKLHTRLKAMRTFWSTLEETYRISIPKGSDNTRFAEVLTDALQVRAAFESIAEIVTDAAEPCRTPLKTRK